MRSTSRYRISAQEVHRWALSSLLDALQFSDHGWKCTGAVVLGILLRAAAQMCSVWAACRDLCRAPSDQAIFNALQDLLPRGPRELERRLQTALVRNFPRSVVRRARTVAVDWHLVPYYGAPHHSPNELYYGKPTKGTSKFHAYATAYLVCYGQRYTIALTWIQRGQTDAQVLQRLLTQIRGTGLKIRRLLLDRQFFTVPVTRFLQQENIPFLMPVVMRGRPPKPGRKARGLRWIRRQAAGWYTHLLNNGKLSVRVGVCVAYRAHKNRKDGKRRAQKLLFAAWKVSGRPTEIRELYRRRFGIESSYRQWRQARITTCTRNPQLRLLFIGIGLVLRNLWVWIHDVKLSEGNAEDRTMHLELLRFRRLLNWIALWVAAELHDGSPPYVELE